MEITYANGKVEKYFKDYKKMQKKLPFEWVKTIKKHMDRLKAAECFGDFLKLRLGKPEQLEGCESMIDYRAECRTGYGYDLYGNRSGRSE